MRGTTRLVKERIHRIHKVQILGTSYAFCEKRSGTTHFRVEADSDGCLPVDYAAAMLAMHCLVRGQSPADYAVMVEVAGVTTSELKLRADVLLEAGRMVSVPARLTRREEEVLRHVMQNLANKEIASALNLSERTVKFHVSALLAKFHVPNRVQLAQEGGRAMMPVPPPAGEANGAIPAVAGSTHFCAASGNDSRRSIRKGDVVQMRGRMTRV